MPVEIHPCPLYGYPESAPFDQRHFRKVLVTSRIFCYCGPVFESPRMTDGELDEFYTSEHMRLGQGDRLARLPRKLRPIVGGRRHLSELSPGNEKGDASFGDWLLNQASPSAF